MVTPSGTREDELRNLYWKTQGQTRTLTEKPFPSEMELEKYVFDNQELLGDVSIIYRQVRTGNKQGIPDMLGVDQDANIVMVELKNQEVDESVLPQALGYAIWAETSPDSIKAIWLESKRKPEDIDMNWDDLNIRLMLVAPSFRPTVMRMAGKLGYQVDLVQVRRYAFEEKEEFVLVEVLEPEVRPKATTTKPKGEWDWEYYESEHGPEATAQLRKAVEGIAKVVERHEWDLPHNLNKYYVGFKLGNRVVFSVNWSGTYAWNVRLKLPKDVGQDLQSEHWQYQRYSNSWNLSVFRPLKPEAPHTEELEPLLEQAYRHVSVTA